MYKRVSGIIILIVFTFGLIPGDYWNLLHTHKHFKVESTSGITFSEKHRTCVSEKHLYDYTETPEYFISIHYSFLHNISTEGVRHLPHPSFLNLSLRAPPVA